MDENMTTLAKLDIFIILYCCIEIFISIRFQFYIKYISVTYIMGCDYYIRKILRIYFDDEHLNFILDSERGYYINLYDEDEEDYEIKVAEYIKQCLTVKTEPIIIYNNNKFNKLASETKYKSMVEHFINDCGKTFSDITKIIKVEERFERN